MKIFKILIFIATCGAPISSVLSAGELSADAKLELTIFTESTLKNSGFMGYKKSVLHEKMLIEKAISSFQYVSAENNYAEGSGFDFIFSEEKESKKILMLSKVLDGLIGKIYGAKNLGELGIDFDLLFRELNSLGIKLSNLKIDEEPVSCFYVYTVLKNKGSEAWDKEGLSEYANLFSKLNLNTTDICKISDGDDVIGGREFNGTVKELIEQEFHPDPIGKSFVILSSDKKINALPANANFNTEAGVLIPGTDVMVKMEFKSSCSKQQLLDIISQDWLSKLVPFAREMEYRKFEEIVVNNSSSDSQCISNNTYSGSIFPETTAKITEINFSPGVR